MESEDTTQTPGEDAQGADHMEDTHEGSLGAADETPAGDAPEGGEEPGGEPEATDTVDDVVQADAENAEQAAAEEPDNTPGHDASSAEPEAPAEPAAE